MFVDASENRITVTLNGEAKSLCTGVSIEEAIIVWALEEQAFAIAINEQFIPKSDYRSTRLQDGDRVEVLVPMQGG